MPEEPRPARKPISKRLRFEIFKRDRFTCVYCGRTPPTVVLQLDHVEAHSTGGSDEASNLVTACIDCNAGKSDRPLGAALPLIDVEAVDEMRERVEQMRAYREWRARFDQELRAELDPVWKAWIEAFGGYEENGAYHSPRVDFPSERVVIDYLSELPLNEIVDAIGVAGWKLRKGDLHRSDVPRYFYGVLRGKARRADEGRRRLEVTWTQLVEQIPELAELHEGVASFDPRDAWHFCGDRLWTNGWTIRFDDGTLQEVAAPIVRIAGMIGPKSENSRDPVLGSQTALDLAMRHIRAAVPACGQTCGCGRPKRPPREADYPRCPCCGQVTEPIDRRESCIEDAVEWKGAICRATPYGQEASILRCEIAEKWDRYRRLTEPRVFSPSERCSGCRTPLGGFHHPGCRFETCTICGELASSGCAVRRHAAKPLAVSSKQAMARLRQMGKRRSDSPAD